MGLTLGYLPPLGSFFEPEKGAPRRADNGLKTKYAAAEHFISSPPREKMRAPYRLCLRVRELPAVHSDPTKREVTSRLLSRFP